MTRQSNDQNSEAGFVAGEIARIVASGEVSYGDCAVMYRTNAQSRIIEEALMLRGLRYQIIGGTRFYERKEIKDLLAYLRLIANPYDDVSLTRVLNWPARGIGERSQSELVRWANELGVPIYQALREMDLGNSPFSPRMRSSLLGFLTTLEPLLMMRNTLSLPHLFDALLTHLDVHQVLQKEYDPEEAADRWGNVRELRNAVNAYAQLPLESQLSTFLEEVALIADVDKLESHADVVTCITLHQAKGLEYPVVFLIGLEEDLLPHIRSQDTREKVEEERRLLYVGMTRARQRLYLCHASFRTTFGRTSVSARTRFLADIPPDLFARAAPFQIKSTPRSPTVTPPHGTPAAPTVAPFMPGEHVHHATFGAGVVVSSRMIENDQEVTVQFADKERRLLASFAKLERS